MLIPVTLSSKTNADIEPELKELMLHIVVRGFWTARCLQHQQEGRPRKAEEQLLKSLFSSCIAVAGVFIFRLQKLLSYLLRLCLQTFSDCFILILRHFHWGWQLSSFNLNKYSCVLQVIVSGTSICWYSAWSVIQERPTWKRVSEKNHEKTKKKRGNWRVWLNTKKV